MTHHGRSYMVYRPIGQDTSASAQLILMFQNVDNAHSKCHVIKTLQLCWLERFLLDNKRIVIYSVEICRNTWSLFQCSFSQVYSITVWTVSQGGAQQGTTGTDRVKTTGAFTSPLYPLCPNKTEERNNVVQCVVEVRVSLK